MAKSNDEVLKDLIHMRRHIMNYIPTTLDNSMSYYELLGKILDYMVNNIGGGFTKEDIENIIQQWVTEHDIFAPRGVVSFDTTTEILNAQDGYYTATGAGFPDADANYFMMVFHNQETDDSDRLSDIFAINAANATIYYLNNGGEWSTIEKFAPRGSKTFDTIEEVQNLKDGYYTATGQAFPSTTDPYFLQVYHTAAGLVDIFAVDSSTKEVYYLTSGGEWSLFLTGNVSGSGKWENGGVWDATTSLPDNSELKYYTINATSGNYSAFNNGVIISLGNGYLLRQSTINKDTPFLIIDSNGNRIFDSTQIVKSGTTVLLSPTTLKDYGNKYVVRTFEIISELNFNGSILKDVMTYDDNNKPNGIFINICPSLQARGIIFEFSTDSIFEYFIDGTYAYSIKKLNGGFTAQGTITVANIASVQNLSDGYYTATGAGMPTSSDYYFLQVYHSTAGNSAIVDCYASNSATGDIYYLTSGGSWSKVNGTGGGSATSLPDGYYMLDDLNGSTDIEKIRDFCENSIYSDTVLLLGNKTYSIDEPIAITHSGKIIGNNTVFELDTNTGRAVTVNGNTYPLIAPITFINRNGVDFEISGVTFELLNTGDVTTYDEFYFNYVPDNDNENQNLNIKFTDCQFNGDGVAENSGANLFNLHINGTSDYSSITNFLFNKCRFYYLHGIGEMYCNELTFTDCLFYGGKSTQTSLHGSRFYINKALMRNCNVNMFLLTNNLSDSMFTFHRNSASSPSLVEIDNCNFDNTYSEGTVAKYTRFFDCSDIDKLLVMNTRFNSYGTTALGIYLPSSSGTANARFIGSTFINCSLIGRNANNAKNFLSQGYGYHRLINCIGLVLAAGNSYNNDIAFNGSTFKSSGEFCRFETEAGFTSTERRIDMLNDHLILRYIFTITADKLNARIPTPTVRQMSVVPSAGEVFPIYECTGAYNFTPVDGTVVGYLFHINNSGSMGDYVISIPNHDNTKYYSFTATLPVMFINA